jgi:hypothetical protein
MLQGWEMTMRFNRLLLWSPRILGILVCLFLGLFSLDAFDGGRTLKEALPDFAIHLAPVFVLLAVVGLSWRREWVGGIVFTGLAAAYAYFARDHLAWIPIIAGPLLIVGVLFSWSWLHHRAHQAART